MGLYIIQASKNNENGDHCTSSKMISLTYYFVRLLYDKAVNAILYDSLIKV